MENKTEYTMLRTAGRFCRLFWNALDAWKTAMVYGAICTVLYYVFAAAFMFCGSSICYMIFGLCIDMAFLCFIADFYDETFNGKKFSWLAPFKFNMRKIKQVVFLFLCLLAMAVSLYFAWKILQKPANPDWIIEFMWFLLMFVLCMIPLLLLRFSAAAAFYLHDLKLPSFGYMYGRTAGKSYISIVGLLFLVIILSVFSLQIYGYEIRLMNNYPSFIVNIFSEFVSYLTGIFYTGTVVCYAEAQRQLMVAGDETVAAAETENPQAETKSDGTDKKPRTAHKKEHKKRRR